MHLSWYVPIALDHSIYIILAGGFSYATINRAFNIPDKNWQQEYLIQLMWLLHDTNNAIQMYQHMSIMSSGTLNTTKR